MTGVLYVTTVKYSLCSFNAAVKIATNFSDDVHFSHAYDVKFTINGNVINIPVEATFSMSVLCPNHDGQYF